MNVQESAHLLRKVQAYRPWQLLDELAGEAWAAALDDVRFADANEALDKIVRETSEAVDPSMVRKRAWKIRQERLERHPVPAPPPDLSEREYREWLRVTLRRIADGDTVPDDARGELITRPVRQAIERGDQ